MRVKGEVDVETLINDHQQRSLGFFFRRGELCARDENATERCCGMTGDVEICHLVVVSWTLLVVDELTRVRWQLLSGA